MLIMTATKLFGILVLLLVLSIRPSAGADNPCEDHAQKIFDIAPSTVQGETVPVYRYGNHGVLYCMVTTPDKYVLIDVTNGADDGLVGEIVLMGDLPSPIAELDNKAECVKYYLVAPGGYFICETVDGEIVDLEDDLSKSLAKKSNATLAQNLRDNKKKNNKMWKKYDSSKARGNPENKSISERDSDENKLKFKLVFGAKGKSGKKNLVVELHEIEPGQSRDIAVGNKGQVDMIKILSNADLSKTCNAIENCVFSDGQATIPNNRIVTEPASLHKIVFTLKLDANNILGDEEAVIIAVVIMKKDGSNTPVVMQVKYPSKAKRTQYTSWSSWRYKWRVPYLGDFPRYTTYHTGSCWRSYASVAWATVFGFFDRRAYRGGSHSKCHNLVSCSYDGTSDMLGCNLKAPSHNDNRMRRYMYHLSLLMGYPCHPTPQTRLINVSPFYRERVSGWSTIISTLKGNTYHGNVANFIWNYSNQGWVPITAVWWGTNWREGVVIGTAYRYRRYRSCFCVFFMCVCGSWRIQYHKLMRFYRGDGYFSWYDLKAANAWVARY